MNGEVIELGSKDKVVGIIKYEKKEDSRRKTGPFSEAKVCKDRA